MDSVHACIYSLNIANEWANDVQLSEEVCTDKSFVVIPNLMILTVWAEQVRDDGKL